MSKRLSAKSIVANVGPLILSLSWSVATSAAPSLETIVVVGERDDRRVEQLASAVEVVEQEELQRPELNHISEALSQVGGLWLSRGEGLEHLTAIRSPVLTGAGACGAFWMGQDGIAFRANGFCNVNQLFEAHYEAASSAEILKGPQSTFLGGNAPYGAIHLRLPMPAETINRYTVSQSNLGLSKVHGQQSYSHGPHALAAWLTASKDEGWRQQSGFGQEKFSLKHYWEGSWASVESGVSLQHLEQETAAYIEGKDAYKNHELRKQNPAPEAYRDAQSLRAYSRWQRRRFDTQISFTPYIRASEMRFLMHFVPWQPTEYNRQHSLGWQFKWEKFVAGGTDLYWGQDFEFTQGWLKEEQLQDAPFAQDRFPQGMHYDYRVDAINAALFAGAYLQIAKPLALDIGLRLDHDSYDYASLVPSGSACEPGVQCRFYRPDDRRDQYLEPAAHMGVIYNLRDHWVSYAQLSRGYRLAQTSELYRAQSPDFVHLQAEHITQLELGNKLQWSNAYAQVGIYYAQNEGGIAQAPDRRYYNGVDSDHLGLEYLVDYRWASPGAQGPVELRISGQVASHRYSSDAEILGFDESIKLKGKQMDTAPKQQHAMQLTWPLTQQLQTKASLRYLGAYYLEPENRQRYPGHTLVDASLQYQTPSGQWLWSGGLNNLFNADFAERADVTTAGEPRYFPGRPRHLFISLEYRP